MRENIPVVVLFQIFFPVRPGGLTPNICSFEILKRVDLSGCLCVCENLMSLCRAMFVYVVYIMYPERRDGCCLYVSQVKTIYIYYFVYVHTYYIVYIYMRFDVIRDFYRCSINTRVPAENQTFSIN